MVKIFVPIIAMKKRRRRKKQNSDKFGIREEKYTEIIPSRFDLYVQTNTT